MELVTWKGWVRRDYGVEEIAMQQLVVVGHVTTFWPVTVKRADGVSGVAVSS
jgi:hypothetical protein